MMTTVRGRRFLHIAWFTPLVLWILVACAPSATPTPSATPVPPTETTAPPSATPPPTTAPTATDTATPIPPTATSAPSPEPTAPAEALVPQGPITPPPANFSPTPPAPPDTGTDSEETWVRDYVALVTAMLNSGETIEGVLEMLRAWSNGPQEMESELASYVWAEAADLDEDGSDEWLISLPVPERGCGVTWCPAYLVIYQYVEDEALFKPRYVVQDSSGEEVQLQHPELLRVQDLNADGEREVLIQQRWCGAHTCFTGLTVGRWDGVRWQDLAADPISQAYTDLTIEDRDADGALEFTMHGGMVGSVGAGLQRPHILVFDWVDGAYRLVEDTPDPSDHPYYLMLDANTALAEGQWERALELAMEAVNDPNFEDSMGPVEEVDKQRIISYAAIEAMLVHAHRGDVAQMESVLERVQRYEFVEPNVYNEATQRLLEVYRETDDVVEACTAMEEVVARRADEAVFFQWYGYNTARLTVDQICPLDAPTREATPQL